MYDKETHDRYNSKMWSIAAKIRDAIKDETCGVAWVVPQRNVMRGIDFTGYGLSFDGDVSGFVFFDVSMLDQPEEQLVADGVKQLLGFDAGSHEDLQRRRKAVATSIEETRNALQSLELRLSELLAAQVDIEEELTHAQSGTFESHGQNHDGRITI